MNATIIRDDRVAQFPAHAPLPMRAGKRHRQPLEARANWDAWLPVREAYPEVSPPLRRVAVLVLALTALFAMLLLLAQVAL